MFVLFGDKHSSIVFFYKITRVLYITKQGSMTCVCARGVDISSDNCNTDTSFYLSGGGGDKYSIYTQFYGMNEEKVTYWVFVKHL